jgi:hypothetical protein
VNANRTIVACPKGGIYLLFIFWNNKDVIFGTYLVIVDKKLKIVT